MKKRFTLLFLASAMISLLAACSQSAAPETDHAQETLRPTTVTVMALKGPTGIGMVEMMDQGSGNSAIDYEFNLVGSPDEVVAALSSGAVDIATIPTNLAANLYSKTSGDVTMLAVNTLGNLSILSSGDDIRGMGDLAGKTIHATGQGANPQYILEYLLKEAGLTPGVDVTIEYHAEHAELAALAASGEIDIAMLPEPFVSSVLSKNKDLKVAIDLNTAWEDATGYSLTMGCVVARNDFLTDNEDAARVFLDDLEYSVSWTGDNIPEAAALCVEYDIIADQTVAEEAIPRCGLVFLSGEDMKPAITNYFAVLEAANPASIGGSMPDDAFFYEPGA